MAQLKNYNGRYCESNFENAVIGFLEEHGWIYQSGQDIFRASRHEVLNETDLKNFLVRDNRLSDNDIQSIVNNVRLVGADSHFATLHKVYKWMVEGIQFKPESGESCMVRLIDFEKPEKNLFKVVNQLEIDYVNNGETKKRRPDVLLYVNGLPVCVIELKNPADGHATIYDAYEQITIRYWRDIPHLLHYFRWPASATA